MASGRSERVTFQYERLNLFCFICGMLDHTESYCDVVFNSDGVDIEKGWTPDLKVKDWGGSQSSGDKWLREGDTDGVKFNDHMGETHPDPKRGRENTTIILTGGGGRAEKHAEIIQQPTKLAPNPDPEDEDDENIDEMDGDTLEQKKRKRLNAKKALTFAAQPNGAIQTVEEMRSDSTETYFLTAGPVPRGAGRA